MISQFRVATRILAGSGALAETRAVLTDLGVSRVVVVADRGLAELGLLSGILDAANVDDLVVATALTDVNPTPTAVEAAAEAARGRHAEAVIGVGGGSALGAAKAVALLLTNPVPALELEGVDRAFTRPAPTAAIPTTAGSGSEVSNALVLHEPGLVREVVIRGSGYEPIAAVLDAVVLRQLPRAPLVFAALDALSHALESLWAAGGSMFTEACAVRAAREILDTLPNAVGGIDDGRNAAGENDAALQRLLEASCLANLACGNSGLALVHALSSSPAVHLPHGMQNGILLPRVAQFNRTALTAEGRALVDRLPALYDAIGFDPRFRDRAADVEAMLDASRDHPFRTNNICDTNDDQLRDLLRDAGATDAVSATSLRERS